ncbi:MAG TPA: nitroreductase family protein [Alphaproteobacteria bacterium]|jgi:nitroreductase
MDFFALVDKRRSIRAYLAQPVERGKVDSILDAVRLAPSAGDLQAFDMVVVEDADTKRALAAAALGQDFVAAAPIVLAFCADPARDEGKYGKRGATLYCIQDATIAAAYAQLAAAALGLASCWVGAFDEAAVARVLRAPARVRPVALLAVGFGAETPERPPRRSIADIARRGHF